MKCVNTIIVFLVVAMFPLQVFGEMITVTGQVTDSTQPINGAIVKVRNSHSVIRTVV